MSPPVAAVCTSFVTVFKCESAPPPLSSLPLLALLLPLVPRALLPPEALRALLRPDASRVDISLTISLILVILAAGSLSSAGGLSTPPSTALGALGATMVALGASLLTGARAN
eukprot:CAMPEP_0174699402 /NCGR_PEP_ID=MMETSP1094-20130205/4691_1 /TAXON_ID=156173 /ORGANISM="Chrysochromulina brevifilum, Strain UTEX LB 985" /LENGTH=112 /DNA_ID=CAMNT_0015896725 /DNA_START=562 /DNA_END=897 /DNA_ORIENTATION=-